MDWGCCLKWVATVIIGLLGANWLFNTFYLDMKRDFTSVALNQQSNIASVRKENETAYYRNFLVPLGFPLITGLGLSLKYKIRNGNFGDVWKAIMELSKTNSIEFTNDSNHLSLAKINGMAQHLQETILSKDVGNVGIVISPSSLEGFVISIASMIGSVKSSCRPHFLSSVPRERLEGLDVLVIDSWNSFRMLNGSERWYKLVIVCASLEAGEVPENVKSWQEIIKGHQENEHFDYDPPEDNSDDSKVFAYTTSPYNVTTSFTQGCLVSGIGSFVQGFPAGHELSEKDTLTVSDRLGKSGLAFHFWHKAFAVLLHGGSLSFQDKKSLTLSALNNTTLLFIEPDELLSILKEIDIKKSSILSRIGFALATVLLSEGVFTKIGQCSSRSIDRLRCVFLAELIRDTQLIASFPKKIPKMKQQSLLKSFTTETLNFMRAHLGARVVVELYCPFIVMGPVCQTNFYDYRVLPASVDSKFICCGPLATSLEGKMVQTGQNPELDITKRQGMLCIRGFTIGKPVEPNRLERAMALSDDFGGGEGWMPLVGVFGLWGQDGCLYIYK